MDCSRSARRYRRVGLVAAVILVASVVELPDRGPPPRDPLGLAGVDKWGHLMGYAVLARLLAAAVAARSWRSLAAVAWLVTAYGSALEWLQRPLEGRLYERGDVVANAVGALLGVATWRLRPGRPRPDGLLPSGR